MDSEALAGCFNSVPKARIVAVMADNPQMTAKEILAALPDVSQATLYRSINQMEEEGIIEVVKEEKKRAIVEKTYSIQKTIDDMKRIVETDNDGDAFYAIMASYLLVMMDKFRRYSQKPDINIREDGVCIAGLPVFASRDELTELKEKTYEIWRPYMERTGDGQRMHIVSLVVTPPEQEEREDPE